MGNPLVPTFAKLFISHHELNWQQNCPNHFKPKLYRQYVDDTFIFFQMHLMTLCFNSFVSTLKKMVNLIFGCS